MPKLLGWTLRQYQTRGFAQIKAVEAERDALLAAERVRYVCSVPLELDSFMRRF